jgi:hypothetical protein
MSNKLTATRENLLYIRNTLAMDVRNTSILIEKLIKEADQLRGYEKDKFFDRLQVFMSLLETINQYDELLQTYLSHVELTSQSTFYKDKYKAAKKYIEILGGDPNLVLWADK